MQERYHCRVSRAEAEVSWGMHLKVSQTSKAEQANLYTHVMLFLINELLEYCDAVRHLHGR